MKTRTSILILLLFASLLAACGGKSPASTATTTITVTVPPQPTTAPTAAVVLPPERIQAAQDFVNLLVQGNFEAATAIFDDTMKNALPVAKLQELWASLQQQAGAFQQQTGTYTGREQGYDEVFVTCQFEKTSLDVKVVFDSSGQIAGLFFLPAQAQTPTPTYEPPAYARTDSFHEQDVTVGSGEWALPGTLTLPNGAGPFPAVVLVQGSGPSDRDETIGPNKPFRDLAWGLASQGVAVLRYEKRTKQYAAKMAAIQDTITVKEETIDDALAAVALLQQTSAIDPQHIFVLGHSLGGMLLPRIAEGNMKIAGLISMAGAARPLEDIILDQVIYLANLDGTVTPSEQTQIDQVTAQVQHVKDLQAGTPEPDSALPLNTPASYWLDLSGYNPPEVAKSLPQPMLILQGGRDYQVTSADFDLWKAALSDRANVTFKFYPNLNHLFMAGEGPGTPEDYNIPGHVDETVIADIAAWIKANDA